MTASILTISMLIYYTSILITVCILAVGASAPPNEAQALMAFKAGISHDPFGRLHSWQLVTSINDSTAYLSPCKLVQEGHSAAAPASALPPAWAGIVCDARTQHVTSVDLRSFNLSGSISPSLSFLPALSHLDLSDNLLSGTLSDALFSPHSPLQYLNLSYNLLEGGLPDSLANLSALHALDLSYNKFEAKMPASLGQLRNLKVLMLEETGLSADIPEEIWQLPALRELHVIDDTLKLLHIALPESLGFCSTITDLVLQGSAPSARGSAIPSSLSECRKLEVLVIDVEGLQGFIAPQIWQLPLLQVLVVWDESLGNLSSGPLPDSFASCPTIKQLALVGFNVAGSSIPSSLGVCHRLEYLAFNVSGLQGSVPSQIWQLPLLQTLIVVDEDALKSIQLVDIVQFKLNGSLPSNFGFCPSIKWLEIDGVNLTGEIPSSLGKCTSLQFLGLKHGSLQGAIPDSFQNLTNLKKLHLQANNLTGGIPKALGACSQLKSLRLGNNLHLSGTIPRELGELVQLEVLSLFTVALSGPMPEEICNCTQLVWLDMGWPVVAGGMGKLPDCMARSMVLLETLGWEMNSINGVVPMKVLQNLTRLQYLGMTRTQLRGSIPHELGNLSQLRLLDLSKNKLLGPLPKSLENCSNLQTLRLFENGLTGEIEHFNFTRLPQLQRFSVHSNNFVGGLPSSFLTSNPQLDFFDVQNNKLSGSFEGSDTAEIMMGLSNLRVLVMSYNNLSGTLPGWLWQLPMLQVLDLSNNQFTGIMPTAVGSLTYFKKAQMQSKSHSNLNEEIPQTIKFKNQVLSYIPNSRVLFDLSMNRLEGEIAVSFGQLLGLTGLNLSHNRIGGRIPTSLGNLVNLEVLDLSHNSLTGAIPEELGNLGGLSVVDLSYNNLEGRIPNTKFFNTRFGGDNFAHNPLLCGAPLERNCSSGEQGSADHNSSTTNLGSEHAQNLARRIVEKIESFVSLWGLLIGYGIGLLGVLYLRHLHVCRRTI